MLNLWVTESRVVGSDWRQATIGVSSRAPAIGGQEYRRTDETRIGEPGRRRPLSAASETRPEKSTRVGLFPASRWPAPCFSPPPGRYLRERFLGPDPIKNSDHP